MCRPLFIANVAHRYTVPSPVIVARYHIRSPHGSLEFIPSPSALPPRTPANYPTSVTPVTLFKIFLVAFGTFARTHSCRASATLRLRPLHQPEHRLVTSGGPYNFVRHPTYIRSLCLMAGLTFVGLTRELDFRMCSRIGPKRRHVRCTVRMDSMVSVHRGSWTHKSHSGGRTDEE